MKTLAIITLSILIASCATNTETKPIDVYALQKVALDSYQKKDWRTAQLAFQRLIEINPGDAQLWYKLGNIYARMNFPDRAIASYKEALVRNPDMSKAWHNIGVVSLRKSTRLFIEMLKYIPADDPLYKQAKLTGDGLLQILEDRRLNPKSAQDYPDPLMKTDTDEAVTGKGTYSTEP
ncbi:hypothetical protein MNBD_GAMMA21-2146 [hydrothermal vent metagenome]|uniref:Uncharacterized protein n=1 Tax=hydrothermal vent metagenome TaxID=652676 RepID=A0A3B0ZGS8_9ZZZZ